MRISVGNLPQTLSEEDLKKLFSEFGTVEEAFIKRDKKTKTSLGFGHVDMPDAQASKAIEKLNEKEIEGKKIVVVDSQKLQNEFKDKHGDKTGTAGGSKINPATAASGAFSATSGVRKSGGGGRGK